MPLLAFVIIQTGRRLREARNHAGKRDFGRLHASKPCDLGFPLRVKGEPSLLGGQAGLAQPTLFGLGRFFPCHEAAVASHDVSVNGVGWRSGGRLSSGGKNVTIAHAAIQQIDSNPKGAAPVTFGPSQHGADFRLLVLAPRTALLFTRHCFPPEFRPLGRSPCKPFFTRQCHRYALRKR